MFLYKVTFFCNNLDIHRMIVCVLTYYKKMKSFLHESYNNVQYLLKCSAFGSVLNKVANWCLTDLLIGIFVVFFKTRGLDWGYIISKSFCVGVIFYLRKIIKNCVIEV